MSTKVNQIKRLVKNECSTSHKVDSWFFTDHILVVEKFAQMLLKKFSNADKEIVFLGVYLHDMQYIRGIKGDHAKKGAQEAEKVMKQFHYPKEIIDRVKEIILAHSCDTSFMPQTLEGKILSSADAMSHYCRDFYLRIALIGRRNLADFKKCALEKLDRDYNKKIFFSFAKKKIKKRHQILKNFFSLDNL